jgi:tetratricopeptide (TPR) repeat protein
MQTIEALAQAAIRAALDQSWDEAIDLNRKILQLESANIPALNRLGRAYAETGETKQARKMFNKVLDLDKHNGVASNAISRLRQGAKSTAATSSNFSFIEEPGKTKTVSLYKLAPKNILGQLTAAQGVVFKTSPRQIKVQTETGTFIGYLPDDLAIHLIRLMKLGNKYEAAIKNVGQNSVDIFIIETRRSLRLKGVPSFPSKDTSRYYQFLPTEPLSEAPMEIETLDDEED